MHIFLVIRKNAMIFMIKFLGSDDVIPKAFQTGPMKMERIRESATIQSNLSRTVLEVTFSMMKLLALGEVFRPKFP